jgi:hypothetical protein
MWRGGFMREPEVHDIAVWFAGRANPNDCYRAFEAYGHAMAAASAFEILMALMVMKAVALRLDKRANANIQPADRRTLTKSLLTSSYDRLQRELRKSFTLSDETQTGLADGKLARDRLAHNFWPGHAGNLFSPDGVDVIATDCAHSANHFRLLAKALLEETGVDAEDYVTMILEDPERANKLKGWQELLREQGLA